MGSYWSFIIDAHACTISDVMVSLTVEHNVDYPKSLQISTRYDVPLAILRHPLILLKR